ncbi:MULTISPECIES: KGGVGR-motif variant AAA ATPase [Streptomyces]|uniref:KGGVGR-motif variant AAA ATPase n=1 Tax=Streptomyces TaxID=1883 RepID=UPI0004D9D8C2|nr:MULTISPECIES: AAA family ATPase [Streptomyces]
MAELTDLEGLNPPEHLFTWVDVDEHLALLAAAGRWPSWLCAADGWWDGIELVVSPGTGAEEVKRWLDEAFGAGSTEWHDGTLQLRLDDPRQTGFTGTPVVLSIEPDGAGEPRRVPLLREKHITPQLAHPLERPADTRFPGDVQLVAFHSFKGGVGRTVHAVAMADEVARRGGSVLLIDADLEAPGITWMHTAQGGQLDFCYEDFLALLQGAENGSWSTAVDIAATYLPNQQVGRYASGGRVTVVPTSRRPLLGPPRIEPADLLTPGRSPYFLTEAFAALAARVNADTVVVDLRAGATELSAPVLLDPRVQRILVTTLSHQALAGTERLLRQLGHRAPALQGIDPVSSVIITQYRQDAHEAQVERARDELRNALFSSLRRPPEDPQAEADATDEVDSSLFSEPLLSPFREELLALPSSWDAVLRVLEIGKIADVLEPIVPARGTPEAPVTGVPGTGVDYTALRRQLAETAQRFIYAELEGMSSASGFLVTDPLRRLLGDHRTEPPLALVVGAKGAGKTFMYTKACAARSWNAFAERSGIEGTQLTAPVVPVLESDNLEYDDLTTQDLRDAFVLSHTGESGQAVTSQAIKDRLKEGLSTLDARDDIGWRRLWLECLAVAAGARPSADGGPEASLTDLGQRARAVFVIDGLEDLLQSLDNDSKRTALRVLLIDVLAWLRSLRGRPLGLVVFVRQDLVTRAVQQNSGQLLARYEPYALRWNKEEALRLALWVTAHANALPVSVAESQITELSYDELIETLIPVWGWKMGTEKSKEARSHLWVPAALGDFKDQVQARDVVVFLAEAAKLSIPQTSWDDRVLAPGAMRKALLACSNNKIDSIQQENQEVGELLSRLQQVRQPVTVPFGLEEVGISAQDADFLVDSGVFARGTDGRYWVAEIYRHGLGFGSERRAKVLWRR